MKDHILSQIESEKPIFWQNVADDEMMILGDTIGNFYDQVKKCEVPTQLWQNLYPKTSPLPRRATTTVLFIGTNSQRIAHDLSPTLSQQGYVARAIDDEISATMCHEKFLQSLERDIWSRKVSSIVAIFPLYAPQISPQISTAMPLHHQQKKYQEIWEQSINSLLLHSPILRSYASRGDLKYGFCLFDPRTQNIILANQAAQKRNFSLLPWTLHTTSKAHRLWRWLLQVACSPSESGVRS